MSKLLDYAASIVYNAGLRPDMSAYYHHAAFRYDRDVIKVYGPARDENFFECLSRLRFIPDIILEVGTGTGHYSLLLANIFRKAKIFGLDIHPEMLSQARSKSDKIKWIEGDLNQLPFTDHSIDLVCASNSPFNRSEMERVAKRAILISFSDSKELCLVKEIRS